jgi:hypothetical protein
MRPQILRAASRPIAAVAPIAVLAAALPPAAPAATGFRSCPAGRYRLVDPSADPEVINLQISMPRRAPFAGLRSGAPSCLVAEAVAGQVQRRAASGPPPRTVPARGARWSVGLFTCSYRSPGAQPAQPIRRAECVHTGRFAATVRFTLRGTA